MENVGIFKDIYGHNVPSVWCSFRSFGIFLPFWYVWAKKNLATLCFTRPEAYYKLTINFELWDLLKQ
jgi:hypothetical protein